MKFRSVLLLLAMVALLFTVATDVLADPPDVEYEFTASGGFRFASINAVGPALVEALANGDATIYLIDSADGTGTNPNTRVRKWPGDDYGDGVYYLVDSVPRPFATYSTSVDSCYVDLTGGATSVKISCTFSQ